MGIRFISLKLTPKGLFQNPYFFAECTLYIGEIANNALKKGHMG